MIAYDLKVYLVEHGLQRVRVNGHYIELTDGSLEGDLEVRKAPDVAVNQLGLDLGEECV